MIKYTYTESSAIQFFEQHDKDSSTNGFVSDPEKVQAIIDSGVEIAPYIEPVKTVEQLQAEALDAINKTVEAECQSLTGTKLYFHSLNSAARHTSPDVQPDADIRARAVRLLQWDAEIDAYCDSVLFNVSEGATMPTLDEFVAGLPTC